MIQRSNSFKTITKRSDLDKNMTDSITPEHVAIIMDGNGRWGIKKRNSRNFGHKKGLEAVEKIIATAQKKNIKFLTLYVFSTENWKRPLNEIKYLFTLLEK